MRQEWQGLPPGRQELQREGRDCDVGGIDRYMGSMNHNMGGHGHAVGGRDGDMVCRDRNVGGHGCNMSGQNHT
jgi:hypothetical protein